MDARLRFFLYNELAGELSPVLAALFNQSLQRGCVPEDWTKAMVTPVFKKGGVHDPGNYRPHGFRKAHSCETQLLLTVDDLVSAHDNKLQVDMGILDFSRAFDTVPHERLVSKLAHYGIRGPILDWIRSFLQNRSMWVVADGECSPSTCVLSGVPQGTVLGPLLFLIYINDLPSRLSPGTTARLFADDCLIYREIRGQGDQVILQKDLIALQVWAATWGMKFNPKKCNTMSITRNKNPFTWMYEMCGEFIHQTEQAKYLGITISNDLKWSTHISTAVTRANHTLHFLSRNLRYCPRQVRETAYFSLVRSTIEYGAVIWDPYLRKDIDTLEMVNRRAARFVTSNHRRQDVSVTALLHDLRWPSLQSRRQQARLVMMYKITNGLVAIPSSRLIPAVARTRANHAHNLGLPPCLNDVNPGAFHVCALLRVGRAAGLPLSTSARCWPGCRIPRPCAAPDWPGYPRSTSRGVPLPRGLVVRSRRRWTWGFFPCVLCE
ncbi:hypothetical protein Bbelb_310190 [Branchiostoma belcheri]|nr:hypothetical protein Bbelb_310190 [Branchiostoma belcheri]